MTRETKVGLLIGLGLILLIGIIVSDHLAVVRQQEPAELTVFTDASEQDIGLLADDQVTLAPPDDAAAEVSDNSRSITPRSDRSTTSSHPAGAKTRQRPIPTPREMEPETARIAPSQVQDQLRAVREQTQPTNRTLYRVDHNAGPVDAGAPAVGDQIHYVEPSETLYEIAQRYYGSGDYWTTIAAYNPRTVNPKGQIREHARLVIPNRAGSREPTAPGNLPIGSSKPARAATITVVEGDTLIGLASAHLGDPGAWPRLMATNHNLIEKPEQLRPGMRLNLPGAGEPDRPRTPFAFGDRSGQGPRETTQTTAAAPDYTVREGDTLYAIARRKLGDGQRWRELYEANRAGLPDPDALVVGQKLRIPR